MIIYHNGFEVELSHGQRINEYKIWRNKEEEVIIISNNKIYKKERFKLQNLNKLGQHKLYTLLFLNSVE